MKVLCCVEFVKHYNRCNDVKCDRMIRIMGWNIGSRQYLNLEIYIPLIEVVMTF